MRFVKWFVNGYIVALVIGLVIGCQLGVQILGTLYVPYGFHGPRNQAQIDHLTKLHGNTYMVFRPKFIKDDWDWFDWEVPVLINEGGK